MKKYFYSVFAAATLLLAASCSQDEDFVQPSGEMTTFSVSLQNAAGTRAIGDGTTATQLYYEVYRGTECILDVEKVPIKTTASIEMPLLKGEKYDIIFWAQNENGIYEVENLKEITVDYSSPIANQESYDAFYNALNEFTADGKTHTIELRRPFAQLNLGTNDWEKAKEGLTESEGDPVTATQVIVKGLATTFNPLTGEATGDADAKFAYSSLPGQETFKVNEESYRYLSLNYLLAPSKKKPQGLEEYVQEGAEGKANVDLTFALKRGGTELFTLDVPNAPVQRNWRTNVIGALLTGSKFDVVIKPELDDEYNYDALAMLKEILTNGGDFTLFSDVTLTEDITVPAGVIANINLDGNSLILDNATVVNNGALSITDGTIKVNAVETSDMAVGIYVQDGGSLDIKDVTANVDAKTTLSAVYDGAEAAVSISNSEVNVEKGGHAVLLNFVEFAEINISKSTITNDALYICMSKANVVIDEKSNVNNILVMGSSTVDITYSGTKPAVQEDGTANVITYHQMSATELEGIYQVEAGKKEYNVTSVEGLMNLNELFPSLDLGEGKGATFNLTTDIDLAGKEWTPFHDCMWVTFNGNGHTIKNMTTTSVRKAGFFGYAGAVTINDLTIENANVTGSQAGIFAGSGEGFKANNCFLKGTNTVTWTQTEEDWNGIGAITGVLQSSNVNVTIVEGTTVTLNKSGMTTVEGCKYIDNLTGYITANQGVVTNNGTVTVPYTVSATDNLTDVLKSGANYITLPAGTYTLPSMADCEGVTIIGAEGTVVGGESVTTGFSSNFGKNTTIKSVTFSGSTNGVRWSYAKGGTSTFENCTFAGDALYGFHIDSSSGATFIFNDCTFSGFNAFAGDLVSVTFNNCTFKHNGSWGHTNIWSNGYFNNCTWEDKTSVSPAGSGKLYFNNVEESYHHEYIGSAESLFSFAATVNKADGDSWTGQAVILIADIDLKGEVWTPIGQTGATEFKGIFDGQNHTIRNLNIDSSEQTGGHYSSGLFGWIESHGSKITIKNVKVDGATVKGHHNVAVIAGYLEGDSKVENCHVANATLLNTHANDDACGDKSGCIAGYAAGQVTISNCTAKNSQITAGRDAGQLVGASYVDVSKTNCSASNVIVTATGDCTGANIANELVGRKFY